MEMIYDMMEVEVLEIDLIFSWNVVFVVIVTVVIAFVQCLDWRCYVFRVIVWFVMECDVERLYVYSC